MNVNDLKITFTKSKMEYTITLATLALTGMLTLERLFKNCAPNFTSCTGLRHADFECSKCLTASVDFGAQTPTSTPTLSITNPLSRPQSNELKDKRRLSLNDLRDILENKPIVNEPVRI